MPMRKILVITYYWPPMSGGGVQRILNFCKYLPDSGFYPIIVTTNERNAELIDQSLEFEGKSLTLNRVDFWFNPARWFATDSSTPVSDKPQMSQANRFKQKLIEFIWLNFFIPDSKIGWYFPARKAIDKILKDEKIDVFITTGPPYTTHILGLYLKKRYNLPWIADVRDPWVENSFYNVVYRFGFVKKIHRILEKRVLNKADRIITVGKVIKTLLSEKCDSNKIDIIYNGHDENNFLNLTCKRGQVFRLGYYGTMNDLRIPLNFIKSLAGMLRDEPELAEYFSWDIYGPISSTAYNTISHYIPDRNFNINKHITHHELIEQYSQVQVFLLLIENIALNKLIITGKLFEYLRAGWPILGMGPESGEAAEIIKKNNAGVMFSYDEENRHTSWLMDMFRKWRDGEIEQRTAISPIFDRAYQGKQLAQVLDRLTGHEGK